MSDNYEDFEHEDVPDDHCPFHPESGCVSEDHFADVRERARAGS